MDAVVRFAYEPNNLVKPDVTGIAGFQSGPRAEPACQYRKDDAMKNLLVVVGERAVDKYRIVGCRRPPSHIYLLLPITLRTTAALAFCVRLLPATRYVFTGKGAFFCDKTLAAIDFEDFAARGLARTLAAVLAS